MLLSKEKFLEATKELRLEAEVDNLPLKINGDCELFIQYIDNNFKRYMRLLEELYFDDTVTLFVIFAIDSLSTKLDPDNYPHIEWRVLNSKTGEEIDSHFSYQLPGDGSFFTNKANVKVIGASFIDGLKRTPIAFHSEDDRTVRIPVLNIPKALVGSTGFLAVQESEMVLTLEDVYKPCVYLFSASPMFIYDMSGKIVDKRKTNTGGIEDEITFYTNVHDRFTLPVLSRKGAP